ncbi:MAG: CRISPR-associated helicase Cas3' [Bacteroidales bacterium]|nr:CRISPR-associated helicase Cas3' [Bacteroidales bacterium]
MQDTKIPKYISHIRKNQYGEIISYQSNEEHCIGVAELAKQFASEFGMGNWGYVLGILHDKGKEKKEFQEYIQDVNGIPGHKHWTKKGKAHAYVGALLAQGLYGKVATIFLGNAICGHHAGLYDYFELEKMISSSDLPSEVQMQTDAIQLNKAKFTLTENQINHLVRVLFSCLVDADYLDTEKFMNVSSASQRGHHKKLSELLILLEDHFCKLNNNSEDSTVNVIRRCVQEQCIKMSSGETGFYSLTVPTGGGKTLSSLLWAMRHAVCNGQKRIIIAIPYTSIIVQTASVLKSIFGEENVLEHHSQFTIDSIIDKDIRLKAKLASENWDYPIVVTTNVQLFESMFSNKPSDCRKLHNIANSVIILDEVQTLPTDYLQPIVDALKSYQRMFGISVLFTTASQPVLSGLIEGCNPKAAYQGIDGITEIIPKEYALHDRLRRVCLEIDNTGSTYDEIADRLSRHDKVLCIVNTRNDAREIFERLPKEGMTIHLSRMMCPRHVTKAIQEIKQALSDNSEIVIRVVATQLIEAGVDIDFPVVYRQEAGLDSILQAAGRCNREGKLDMATAYVFSLSVEHKLYGSIIDANNARLNMVNVNDWFAPETMTEYFRQLYCRKETFDKNDIKTLLYKPAEMCFAEAAKKFRLIEETGKTVYVNMDDSLELIERLKSDGITYSLMKELSQYSVNIHERDFQKLNSYEAIEEVIEGIYVVKDRAQYDENIGLRLDNHWMNEILTI